MTLNFKFEMVEKMENDKSSERKQLVQRYWEFVRPYRFVIILVIALGIMSFAVPLALPMMVKILIDDILPGNESFWSLNSLILIMGGIFVFGIIVNFIRDYITARLGNQMGLDIRMQLYSHLQKLSPQYYDNRQIGTIVSRVQNDVNGAQNLVRGGVINLVIDMFMVVFAGIMDFTTLLFNIC